MFLARPSCLWHGISLDFGSCKTWHQPESIGCPLETRELQHCGDQVHWILGSESETLPGGELCLAGGGHPQGGALIGFHWLSPPKKGTQSRYLVRITLPHVRCPPKGATPPPSPKRKWRRGKGKQKAAQLFPSEISSWMPHWVPLAFLEGPQEACTSFGRRSPMS